MTWLHNTKLYSSLKKTINFYLTMCVCMCLVTQFCLTLCNPMDCSLPGSSVHGIISRQEYRNGLPFPSPGDLPNPGIKSGSLALQTDSLSSKPSGKPLQVIYSHFITCRRFTILNTMAQTVKHLQVIK